MRRQRLQIDLNQTSATLVEGYAEEVPQAELPGRLDICDRLEVGERVFFLRGVLLGLDRTALAHWLERYDGSRVGTWASEVDGDFNVVIWDRPRRTVTVVSDRVGAHRLYVNAFGGVVSVTNTLLDQVRLQRRPRLGRVGSYTLLTLQYPLDPYSLLEDTWVVALGDVVECGLSGIERSRYHEPVDPTPAMYHDTAQSVAGLDAALRRGFAARLSASTVPLVMLSGGIDSVTMAAYLTELAPGRVESFTFAVEGQRCDEREEARIAARYFGTRHHELVIPRRSLHDLALRSVVETDMSSFGGFSVVAIADALAADGRPLDVFRGEDTRLHTPSLDSAALLGLTAMRAGLHRSELGRTVYGARRVISRWPYRFGRNYIGYVLRKSELRPSLHRYALEALSRFSVPDGCPSEPLPELLEATAGLSRFGSLDEFYRRLVAFHYRVQYTEDMHGAAQASETASSRLTMPFYAPEVVAASNRIPLRVGLRPLLVSPKKTRSPYFLADKHVLRRLLDGRAPEQLLYRRKATAGAGDEFLEEAWSGLIEPVLRSYRTVLLDHLEEPTRSIARCSLDAILASRGAGAPRLGTESALLKLATLARLCSEPGLDLATELQGLVRASRRP